MAKKYLVEVADKGGKGDVGGEKRGEKDEGHKGGSDYRGSLYGIGIGFSLILDLEKKIV